MKPKLDNIRKWCEALESGEYPQGREHLVTNRENGTKAYCCLGVACDLALKDGVVMKVVEDGEWTKYSGTNTILPLRVAQWLGIDAKDPIVMNREALFPIRATFANDKKYWSFRKIATAVRHTFLDEPLPDDFKEMT